MRAFRMIICGLGVSLVVPTRLFAASVSCDPLVQNDCATNYTCKADGTCTGDPIREEQSCTTALNPCMSNPVCMAGVCTGTVPADTGTPCNLPGGEKCYAQGHCMKTDIPGFSFSFCVPGNPKNCDPPSDPCKVSFCNPATGNCDVGDKCNTISGCETCDAGTGMCSPANIGSPCSNPDGDFNPCTSDDRCASDTGSAAFSALLGVRAAQLTAYQVDQPRGFCEGVPGGAVPTPTAGPMTCVGDCSHDSAVTVDEVLTMVNIALGSGPASDCLAGDVNQDGQITVDEILAAVNNALNGC